MRKTYAVFGLGRYGIAVARELVENGMEVIAVDSDEQIIIFLPYRTDKGACLGGDPQRKILLFHRCFKNRTGYRSVFCDMNPSLKFSVMKQLGISIPLRNTLKPAGKKLLLIHA